MRLAQARHQLFFTLILVLLSLHLQWLSLRLVSGRRCASTQHSQEVLLETLATLRASAPAPPDTIPLSTLHPVIRRLSTSLLANPGCLRPVPRRIRSQLEFSLHARPPTDGVLLYIFAVVGARNRIAIELHTHSDARVATTLAVHHGWRVFNLLESWTGYDGARIWYEQVAGHALKRWSEAGVDALDAGRVAKLGLPEKMRRVGIGGMVDLLVLFSESGDDVATVTRLDGQLRPRVLLLKFEDYWGATVKAVRSSLRNGILGKRVMRAKGIKHDYAGASIASWIDIGTRAGYRLVWCFSGEPIAIFVDEKADVGNGALQTIDGASCIKSRNTGIEWRRDMEAMWDEAQEYNWDKFT